MPPQLQALLENKRNLAIAGAVLVLVIITVILLVVFGSGGGESATKAKSDPGVLPLDETQLLLADGVAGGKAIEIRGQLARQGIRLNTVPGTGGNVSLYFSAGTTLNDRDNALLAIAQSGLMDGKLGMEAFDTSDMMASREEKQIKLVRAQEGDMSRIIRKMTPIEDAFVKISIPDPTLFASDRRPPSAAVQVVLPPGDRLSRDKTRAIINLLVGAVQGLESKYVALSDTNGNTYNSVLDSSMELNDKAEQQDFYMKQKVSSQLDKLIGAGHYVVTVATSIRESPKETMVQNFDPSKSVVATKQRFKEKLGNGGGSNMLTSRSGGPVSGFLPPELDSKVAIEKQLGEAYGSSETVSEEDGYLREGTEVAYQNGHSQWVETSVPGMIEAISVAVTIDDGYYPNIPPEDLQLLIARAASPKVMPQNVSIARTDFENPKPLEGDSPIPDADVNAAGFMIPGMSPEAAKGVMTWLPWMAISVLGAAAIILLLGNAGRSQKSEDTLENTISELHSLRQHAEETQEHLKYQQQLNEQLMQTQQQQHQALEQTRQQNADKLKDALKNLNESFKEKSAVQTVRPRDVNLEAWLNSDS